MNCKSCGTSNPEGAVFCRKCGKKLKEDGNNGCLKTIAWLVVIGVIGCVIALIYNNQSNYTPSNPSPSLPSPATPPTTPIKTTTYLNISNDDLNFDEDGGSKTISISTDGEWDIGVDVADWVTLSKTSSSITVRVEPNERGKRTDYFTIVADDITKRVDITQSANTKPYGEIEEIWVDHNVYEDGKKGMKIHVKFDVCNMLGSEGRVSVYFYDSNDEPLTDLNDKYHTESGEVSVGKDFTPRYDNSEYKDFKLFMPYNELHLDESAHLYFEACIWYGDEKISDESKKVTFEYTVSDY